jgi:ABC-2 type transport system ATP-binding protein
MPVSGAVQSGPAIRAEDLTKYYGPIVGVENLSFQVERGETYGFLGANGAGKTTTMRLLLDLLRPTAGRATVLGVDCRRDSLKARRLIGYLPGELPVYPDLTAAGYLDYLARLDARPVSEGYLRELFERFDVSGVDLGRRLRDQSHGMKQKIGIIQALMYRPPVLILDEPTAGLDPLMVQAFRETIDAIRKRGDTTVFLSSHVLAEVESMCERIGLVRGGRMVATETMSVLRQRSRRTVSVHFDRPADVGGMLPAGVSVTHRSDLEWVLEVEGPLGPLVRMLAALPVRDLQVAPFRLDSYIASFYGVDVRDQP